MEQDKRGVCCPEEADAKTHAPSYTPHERFSLKNHPVFNEACESNNAIYISPKNVLPSALASQDVLPKTI
jgi:hypothetical protein